MPETPEQGQTPDTNRSTQNPAEPEQAQAKPRFQSSERRNSRKPGTHFDRPRNNAPRRNPNNPNNPNAFLSQGTPNTSGNPSNQASNQGNQANPGNRNNAPGKVNCPAELTPGPKHDRPPVRTNRRFSNQSPEREPQKTADGHPIRQPFDGKAHLYEVIQVRLVRNQRLVEVNTNGLRLEPNTAVLVRIHRNILLASTVGYRYRRVAEINSLPFVVRAASDTDITIDSENALIEKKAQELASKFAIAQNLQMKVLSADLSHDHKNITINFASDVRVDFREMVAYLANQLKLRVEMYQLGLRNGTGIICGLGSCGQLLCCGRFLGQFDPIAVKQLRAQGLATNPKRISGVCGRLYCCMSYEYCDYMRERRSLPKKGKRIFTRWGIGRVTDIDMLREEIVVTYENGEIQRLTANDFVPLTDEIAANVEAGKYDFPLEPAKFYLNHDPNAAAEPDLQSRHSSTQPERPIEATPKKSHRKTVRAVTPKTVTPSAPRTVPKQATANSSHAAPTEQTPENICLRRRHTLVKHHDPAKPAAPVSRNAAPAKPEATATAENNHVTRITRKVHPHQTNLEEAMNANAIARNTPQRTSRRRYSPMNQPPEQD
ncbi:MAG: hypothetical protein IJU23_01555 [Proteobacteria bacterium]|nr:hypothetical protein [Pseudomonadota bacterium]